MKGLGVIWGPYLPAIWTWGVGNQDLALCRYPWFRKQTVLQWRLLLVFIQCPAYRSCFRVFGEHVHPSE